MQKRESSDGSDLDVSQSRSGERKESMKKQKFRRERDVDSDANSHTESDESCRRSQRTSGQVETKKAEHDRVESIVRQKKSPSSRKHNHRQQSPRRAKASQTSVLESVSPARKQHNRLGSPRRAKLSQSSVLENFEGDAMFQNKSSPKSTDDIVDDNSKPKDNQNATVGSHLDHNNSHDVRKEPSSTQDSENQKEATRGDQSYWLTGDSDSDWDFDGPMILPPPPM